MVFGFLNRKKELTHDGALELLSTYLDGRLPHPQQQQLDRHISSCQRCRDELSALRATRQMLQALPPVRLPRAFTLSAAPRPVPLPRSFFYLRTATAVAAAVLVILLAAQVVLPWSQPTQTSFSTAPSTGRQLAAEPTAAAVAAMAPQAARSSDTAAAPKAAASAPAAPAPAVAAAPSGAASAAAPMAPAAAAGQAMASPGAPAPAAAAGAAAQSAAAASAAPSSKPAPAPFVAAPDSAAVGSPQDTGPTTGTAPPATTASKEIATASHIATAQIESRGLNLPSALLILLVAVGALAILLGLVTGGIWWKHRTGL